MNRLYKFLWFASVIFLFSCEEDIVTLDGECGPRISIVGNTDFMNNSDPFTILDANVSDDCLSLTIQYGGGCGDVEGSLFGRMVLSPNTSQLFSVLLFFDDNDDCEALVQQTFDFDITPLQISGFDEVFLSIGGFDEGLTYLY